MDAASLEFVHIFEEARRLLEDPNNDFSWSSWEDSSDALKEIDGVLAELRRGGRPQVMSLLFAATGPMQEVSLSSAWGDAFVELGNRFDRALSSEIAAEPCTCRVQPARDLVLEAELGIDGNFGEASLWTCPHCGQLWLRYSHENEAFSRSGRWYLGAIPRSQVPLLRKDSAKAILEGLDCYFYGGSYFDGRTGTSSGPISI